ncbi:ATP-binding protein [Frateuria aurantia]
MKRDVRGPGIGPSTLARSLAWLRLCAVLGQSAAVLVCTVLLGMALPLPSLALGILCLALFSIYAYWRLSTRKILGEWEVVLHMAVDTLVLGYLLYLTGGADNPFITLLLVPIALAATTLRVPSLLWVSGLAGLVYLTLLVWYLPLALDSVRWSHRALRMTGATLNFAIMACMLALFSHRQARSLRRQQVEVQRVRERALRDEGILAIATQAAGAAHELNTPLSTMRMLLPELRRQYDGDAELAEDLELLEIQVERCRGILREMVAFGKAQLTEEPEIRQLSEFIQLCLARFQLLRPEVDLQLTMHADVSDRMIRAPVSLRHALINLLNNAADASALCDSNKVELHVDSARGWLDLLVIDRGPGFSETHQAPLLGRTGKRSGLGLGMALTQATAERLNGELSVRNLPNGAEVCLRLPLEVAA